MALTAVILAGIPGPALQVVRDRLEDRYPQGFVFRGAAARVRATRRALYDVGTIDGVLEQAVDAVYGSSRRPLGFCRNHRRGCKDKLGRKLGCSRTGSQACFLLKPTRLFVLYQEGDRQDDLLREFYYSALACRIPSRLYNKRSLTADFCEEAIETLRVRAAGIEPTLRMGCPLLLPPKAFGKSRAVRDLLDRVAGGTDPVQEIRDFKRDHFNKVAKKYEGRSGLGFAGAQVAGLHGAVGDQSDARLALSRRFRLGCEYPDDFHWDISPVDGSKLAGGFRFDCRATGVHRPTGKNVNMLVDDCIR